MLKVIMTALLLNGCAYNERFTHSEATFDDGIFNASIDSKALQLSSNGKALPLYEICANYYSVHSPLIWLPVIGPMIDVSISNKTVSTSKSRFDELLIFVPILGPILSYSYTSPELCTYKTIKKAIGSVPLLDASTPIDDSTLQYIIGVSNRNCIMFLNRLSSSENSLAFGKNAMTDIAGLVSAGTAFVNPIGAAVVTTTSMLVNKGADNISKTYFNGQLTGILIQKIEENRKHYYSMIQKSPPSNLANVFNVIQEYDGICSINSAIQSIGNTQTLK